MLDPKERSTTETRSTQSLHGEWLPSPPQTPGRREWAHRTRLFGDATGGPTHRSPTATPPSAGPGACLPEGSWALLCATSVVSVSPW